MLSIFTVPKPFVGQIGIIQKNAIKSWLALGPAVEVILFGNDEGIYDAAKELGVYHVEEVDKNELGTPLLSSAFQTAGMIATNDIFVYINTDIIIFSDFIQAIGKIDRTEYLISGRRWDLTINGEIDFNDPGWQSNLRKRIEKEGRLHGPSGIDYFIFPKNMNLKMPPFAVGRPGWDNWFIFSMRSRSIPVIDATDTITIVHQAHPAVYHSRGPESLRNSEIAGGLGNMMTLRDADWVMNSDGISKPEGIRRVYSSLSSSRTFQVFLSLKRGLSRKMSS